MRLVTVVPTLFAGLLGVPALVGNQAADGSLTSALSSTVRALEYLSGVEEALADGDETAIRRVLAATEPAELTVDPAERERHLAELREHVAGLQAELDWLEAVGAPPEDWTGLEDPTFQSFATPPTGAATTRITTGLDPALRQQLAEPPAPDEPPAEIDPQAARASARKAFEEDGYVADPLRLGRSLFRAGRLERAVDVLAQAEGDPEATYWTARALERLGRFDEALAAFDRVVEAEDAGDLAQQARNDADFLKWRRDFAREIEDRR